MDTALEVLKWIGIALAAGFVGYFGRHLAMMIIDKISRKKPEPPPPEAPSSAPSSPSDVALAAQAKVDKKRAKAEAKRAKKEGKG
ncbi:MAG: hypothetical protein JSV77_01690 [Dehalococcoidales bacterium]|nr:MAG: hypothetical protein JSV77_01690 [Dehalococcoidales bacterium]